MSQTVENLAKIVDGFPGLVGKIVGDAGSLEKSRIVLVERSVKSPWSTFTPD
jgi:hypothetical protein